MSSLKNSLKALPAILLDFKNGVEVISDSVNRSFQPKSIQLGSTRATNGGSSFFNGCLERVSIYSGNRTAGEVRQASIIG